MNGLLLDTHIWLWFVSENERLPSGLAHAIATPPSDLWLSPVSVWELGLLVSRGRVQVEPDLRAWVLSARATVAMKDAPMTQDVAVRAHEIPLAHRDPADRILAATALSYDLTLVTVDERLVGLDWLPTLHG